jgi:hypothetical protein
MAHSDPDDPTAIGRTMFLWTLGGAIAYALAAYVLTRL